MEKFLSTFIKERLFSRDRIFIFSAMTCGFFISMDYAFVRPASTSYFITYYGASFFPYVWLALVPLSFLVVYLYNCMLPHFGCLKTFFYFALSIVIVNTFAAIYIDKIPSFCFFHAIWKDIYILLAFKQLWSLIHTTIDKNRARYLYGIIFGAGCIGSIVGGFFVALFAVDIGSKKLFFVSLLIYSLIFLFYSIALKKSAINRIKENFREELCCVESTTKGSFLLIKRSKYLILTLLLVVCMQVSITLIAYQFNIFLERSIYNVDLRTQYYGRIISIINCVAAGFQFLGGFVVIYFLGFKNSHLLIPIFLTVNSLFFLVMPVFFIISYSYVAIKSLDFSLFHVLREMLYIPMKLDEKFRAKAIIDVFAYRGAKTFAAGLILLMEIIPWVNVISLITIFTIFVFIVWELMVIIVFKNLDIVTEVKTY